ncbi:hypothetical protein TVAG_251050 [Trichomonas vaginalis G3]|uniref:Uncharacterized protein n=1 Tax=Trichomonas vaginalis (strain ATCC PRA-98 / G3) TaxID=412133 RepID=A2FX30_TRIV3|nr:ribonuclease inhibitor domain-containing protein [Trichomonas vaginalis G3]EAX90534.1 hypothetical protein TVAG_251050 [Trichomonas vaginalis G3]KAI5539023.1 ribonuclease inhibitor domain-containing protein [Trichomonas vaginalis G3]|eukprot:XP_001303464.1 hypothetical protein [Trichomonas vaginalis G3]
MTEISFPDSVTYLGSFCFAVARIKIFNIGKNVNYIGICIIGADDVLEKIIVDRNNPYYAHDGLYNLYSKNFTVLYQVNAIQEHYVTLQTVNYFKSQAINSIPIKSVTITQDCYFESNAISYCDQLVNITFHGRILSQTSAVVGIYELSIIWYYSSNPVYKAVLASVPISNIVVYCCNSFNSNFSTIVPIKSFECVNPVVQSCKVNPIRTPFNISVFIAMLLN